MSLLWNSPSLAKAPLGISGSRRTLVEIAQNSKEVERDCKVRQNFTHLNLEKQKTDHLALLEVARETGGCIWGCLYLIAYILRQILGMFIKL